MIDRRSFLAITAALCAATGLSAKEITMSDTFRIEDVFLLLITDKITECRDFYVKHFGFTVAFESKIYTQIASPEHNGRSFSLAFMPVKHPFGVIPQVGASGQGLMLTIQTADSTALHARLKAAGVPIIHPLTDEPWGQRRFDVRDPAGTYVDVVQSIDTKPGYFEQFQ